MQYILDEREYKALIDEPRVIEKNKNETINNLCRIVCDHLPIDWGWGDEDDPKPWGCILSKNYEWYCDQCPVLKHCTMDKHYSK